MAEPHVFLLYHFFHPDDVISARLFSELGCHLADRGCSVVAMPGQARCHDYRDRLPRRERWRGISIHRIFRPALSQHRISGRIINTLFMLGGWSWRAVWMRRRENEVMIVGTDPILAVLVAISWRLFRPRSKIIHWCHDLYPDAAVADGLVANESLLVAAIRRLLRVAYRRCDTIADLGPCMRERLMRAWGTDATDMSNSEGTSFETFVPWSLVEPTEVNEPDKVVRESLFGATRLGILYSGNLGRAHDFESVLEFARRVQNESIQFCFAGRGPGIQALQESMTEADSNINFAGFADESVLTQRLTATDIHLVTLRPDWTGTVVPSKFFGAVAVGRPVLFAGSDTSAIAHWIREYEIGWVLNQDSQDDVYEHLRNYACSPHLIEAMQARCLKVYQQQFSSKIQLARWLDLVSGTTTFDCCEPEPEKSLVKGLSGK